MKSTWALGVAAAAVAVAVLATAAAAIDGVGGGPKHSRYASVFDNDEAADMQALQLDGTGDGAPLFYKLRQLSSLKGTCEMQSALRDLVRSGSEEWSYDRCGSFMRQLGRGEWYDWTQRGLATGHAAGAGDLAAAAHGGGSPLACPYKHQHKPTIISPQCDHQFMAGFVEQQVLHTTHAVTDLEVVVGDVSRDVCQEVARGTGRAAAGLQLETACHRAIGRGVFMWLRAHVDADEDTHPQHRRVALDTARRACVGALAAVRYAADLPPSRYACESGAFEQMLRERMTPLRRNESMALCEAATADDRNVRCCRYVAAGVLADADATVDDAINYCTRTLDARHTACCVRGLGAHVLRMTHDFGQVEVACVDERIAAFSDECFNAAFAATRTEYADGFEPSACDSIALHQGWRRACVELADELIIADTRLHGPSGREKASDAYAEAVMTARRTKYEV